MASHSDISVGGYTAAKIWGAFVLFLACYLLVGAIYRAYFHPLAKYKGPKLLAISNILPIWYALKGQWVHKVLALHEYYGPVVRIAPNEISYVTEEAWNDIYKVHKDQPQLQKYMPVRPPGTQHGLFDQPDDEVHANIRRVLNPSLNEKGVREREPILKKHIDLLLKLLGKSANGNEVIDINKSFQSITSDITGDLLMGEPFGSLEQGIVTPVIQENFLGLKGLAIGVALNRNFFSRKFFVEGHRPRHGRRRNHGNEAIVKAELKRPEESWHFSHPLSEHLDHPLAQEVAADLITAGSDTVAIGLSGIIYLLLRDQAKMNKLVTEIRTTFRSLDQITLSNVNSLKYQNAVIPEGLRLWPPGPETMRRVTTSHGNAINGEWVPAGTLVGVYHWVAGRYSPAWKDAEKFIPERWLHEDERYADDQRGVVNSFQVGPRNCIGQRLALAETRLILASLLWSFDVKLHGQLDTDWMNVPIFGLVAEKKPLLVSVQQVQRI